MITKGQHFCGICVNVFVVAEDEAQAQVLQERAGWKVIDGLKACSVCQPSLWNCPECGSPACIKCMVYGQYGWMCGKCLRFAQFPRHLVAGRRERPWQERAMGLR